MARIFSAPVLSYWIVTQQHSLALIGCCVAGASDVLDGYLAKRYHMTTVLGTYLDPLADKILINVLSLSLWYTGTLPTPLVAVWLLKDAVLMTATYRYVAQQTSTARQQQQRVQESQESSPPQEPPPSPPESRPTNDTNPDDYYVVDPLTVPLKVNPTLTSKINTALQFVTLSVGIVHPLVPLPEALTLLCWTTGATTLASAFSYVGYSAFTDSGNPVPPQGQRRPSQSTHPAAPVAASSSSSRRKEK